MSSVLNTTKQITFDDLLTGRLEQHYGITVVSACEAEPVLYLCAAGDALRVRLDDNGYCYFAMPEKGGVPSLMFDAINREFDCGIERLVDDRGRAATSLDSDSKQALIYHLGNEYLAPGDLILSCIDGRAPPPEPGSLLCEQVKIARALLKRNPQLHEDTKTLLLLVEDLYEQRHPPFKVTLRNKNPVVAQLFAEAMLAWAQAGQHAPNTNTSHLPGSSNSDFPLTPAQEEEWLRLREDEGRQIDPETAEVTWRWGLTLDPYGIHPDLPAGPVQRNYFARSPGSDMWVHFDDLPEATRRILSEKAAQDILPLGKVVTTKHQA